MDGAAWLEARAQRFNAMNGSTQVFQLAGNNQNATAAQLISEFRFAAAKSIRTSTIILAAFNAVAAASTAFGILYDSYSTRKRNRSRGVVSTSRSFIPPADVYPLVLSFGIMIQGIGFSVAQAKGLDDLLTRGCTLVSQFMLPAVFIVPYIQLIFGVEMALRGLVRKPFPPRGRWTVKICLVIIGMLLLANFLVADFIRAPDLCFASLFWFVSRYAMGCFAVLLVISVLLLLAFVIIFVRLSRSINIETCERVTASRMVYYLALAILSNVLMLPFFFTLAFTDQGDPGNQTLTLSMVASVVANVSGLMTGGLYLFLRSNTISTIGPKNKAGEYERQKIKHQIRRFGPSGDNAEAHMMQPVGALDLRRMLSDASLISTRYDKEEEATLVGRTSPTYDIGSRRGMNPLRSNAVYPADRSAVKAAEPTQPPPSTTRKLSTFSAFSRGDNTKSSLTLLPATIYTPGTTSKNRFDFSTLKPPPSIRNLAGGRHRRDSSMASSATVQIGLRLSNVEDMPPLNTQISDQKVYTLECPKEQAKETAKEQVKRPSPLVNTDSQDDDTLVLDESVRRDPVRDARMKTLPPVPRAGDAKTVEDYGEGEESEEEAATLSPTVYRPPSPTKQKLPSPRGVGFSSPPLPTRSNSNTVRSPPPRQSPRRAVDSTKAGDWI